MRGLRLWAAVAAVVCVPAVALAGPWGRPRGGLYAKLGYGYQNASELATPDGTIAPIPTFEKNEAHVYLAYGWTDRVTVAADAVLFRESSIEGFESARGIGDTRLGAQSRLGRAGPWLFAARGVIQIPTGDVSKGEGLLPTGSGVWEGAVFLSVGRSLAGGRGWAFAEVGPQFRGGGLRDGLVYDGQVGVKITSWLSLAFNLRGVQPWDTTPGPPSAGSAAGLGDGVTYLTLGPSVFVTLRPGLGVQAGMEGITHARNIAKGPTFRFGFFVTR